MGFDKEKIIACGYVSVSFCSKMPLLIFLMFQSFKKLCSPFCKPNSPSTNSLTFPSSKNDLIFHLFTMNVVSRQ